MPVAQPPRSTARRVALGLTVAVALWSGASLLAQIPGRNVNMVAGTDWPGGDPFLQRQNEPSIAASTRNPLHLLAGSNDYRTVDVPGLPDGAETGDAWISVYKSFDGGSRWSSTLMPGYPQEPVGSPGRTSPLYGYQAAADPVVRAGVSGLVFYNGLVFDRGENGKSGIFVARFIDRNNQEAGDSIAYLGASMVATSPDGAVFLDKPWMVVDIPRGNANLCVVGGTATGTRIRRNGHRRRGRGNGPPIWVDPGLQYVEAGPIYVGYTAITGEGPTLQSQIFVKRSLDCGATWSQAMRVSQPADRINQGLTMAVSPATGDLFAAWRRFSSPDQPDADAVMVSRLRINGGSFDAPGRARGLRRTGPVADALERIYEHRKKRRQTTTTTALDQIDQNTGPFRFRTNAYPALTVDGTGRAYIAWAERGFAAINGSVDTGESRIVIATTTDGRTVTPPAAVDEQAQSGHQLMPSLAFAGGRLMLVFYDQRETSSRLVGTFVDDAGLITKRNTIDIRASLGTPGPTPTFAPSVRVSDYLVGFTDRTSTTPRQLQFNPPNLPMFRLGTVPFIGDYIDVAPSPAFVPTASGDWVYNTASTSQIPLFHAVWTDNRDVRPPLNGDWTKYAPPTVTGQFPGTSLFDPAQQVALCQPGAGNAGSRNQNIYTARIGGGLLVGSPGNSKQLSPTVQRGFVVFAQNQTTVTKTFRMRVLAQPPGGRASFEQFPLPPYTANSPAPVTFVDVRVPARSTASRTVYATSTDPRAQISVDVTELATVGGVTVPGGLAGRTVLNPDIENPDIENPDIENPDVQNPDIENAEVYNPDIENPDIENPDIENPDIENPDIENPDIENPDIENPDIENIVVDNSTIANPDIENPDIENPDIENPDIENPDIENGTISDVTWSVTNIGNTTSAFNVNVFLAAAGVPSGINTQLIVYKTYKTPVLALDGCSLKTETRNVVLFNVPSPNFVTPGQGLPDQNDPSEKNATLWLNPGEVGRVTLRVYDSNRSDNVIVRNLDGTTASIDPRFNPNTVTTVGISAQGVDVLDPPGATEPPAVTTTGTNLFFLQQPVNVVPGAVMAPSVRVRIWDNTGAPLPGATVSLALCGPQDPLLPVVACPALPGGVTLSGTTTAVADVDGIATFNVLSVSQAAAGLTLRASASAAGVVAAGTSAPFEAAFPGGPWSATGSGVVTLVNDGATGTPSFTYDNPGVSTGAWTLSRVAPVAETVNLTYAWNGFHSFFQVTTGLEVFVRRGGVDVFVQPLVNEPLAGEGPVVCCAFPSGGFTYAGATAVSVQAGDTYGFRVSGSHADIASAMNGTFAVVAGGTPQFTVPVRATAGGLENQDPLFGPASVPARVYGGTLAAGQQVTITATGLVQRGAGFAPNGVGGTGTCDGTCLLAGAPIGSLLARVGSGPWQLVGGGPTTLTAASAGLLQFAINDNFFTDNTGGFQATVVWGSPLLAAVSLSNWAQIFDGTPKAVTVTTAPVGLATAVSYSGSATVPSAIGAYLVEAVAVGPGYLGRGSLTQTIASTVSAGGFGGGPFPLAGALSCAPGVFANGMRASNSGLYGLGSGQLICESGVAPAPFVAVLESPTASYTDVTCGVGEVMVGLHGTTFAGYGFRVLSRIAPQCQPLGGGAITNVGPVGGAGGSLFPTDAFSLTCPAGQAVTGVLGGAGEVVDSLALACGTLPVVPPTPVVTSVSPAAQVAPSQMLTINGTALPATSLNDVLFNQGGPDIPAQFMWSSSPTRAIVRLPSTLAVGAPTTVRLKNPANTVSTAAVPLNIAVTPGTPVLSAVLNQCGPAGAPISTVVPAGPLAIAGEGIDTSGTSIVFTNTASGLVLTQSFLATTAGPTGTVCSYEVVLGPPTLPGGPPTFTAVGAPAGLTSGTWNVQIRTTISGIPSALSNAIAVTVP